MPTNIDLLNLLNAQDGPFVTLMLDRPTTQQEVNQTNLSFKNFLKQAAVDFANNYSSSNWDQYEENFTNYQKNNPFWQNKTGQTIALIGNSQQIFEYELTNHHDEQAVVSMKPYILPIINDEIAFNYLVLALNQDSFILYRGDQHHVNPIDLPQEAPNTMTDALGTDDDRDNALNSTSRGHNQNAVHHSHNEKSAEVRKDQVNYYQQVADYVVDNFAQFDKRPIILFALPENQAIFRKVANSKLISERFAVDQSPANNDFYQVQQKVLKVVPIWFQEQIETAVDDYRTAVDKRQIMDQPYDLIEAILSHQVRELLIMENKSMTGIISPEGTLVSDTPESQSNNFLNDLAILALQRNIQVLVVPADKMPSNEPAVGLLRYTTE